MNFPLILIVVFLIAILLTYFIVFSSSKEMKTKRIPNYRALFIIGITWIPLGITTHNPGLWGAGIVFSIIGLKNKDKWGKETKWADLPPNIRRFKMILISLLIVFLIVAMSYLIVKSI